MSIQIIDDEKLQQNSLEVGTYFLKGLQQLETQYEVIGDVRGKVITFILFSRQRLLFPLHYFMQFNVLHCCIRCFSHAIVGVAVHT